MSTPAPTPIITDALETFRQVNEYLRSALLRLHPERTSCAAVRSQELSALCCEIRRARECLRRLSADSAAAAIESDALDLIAVKKESLEYRRHLERLDILLPDLHGRLLAEKSRLEAAKNRVATVTAWAGTSRKTL